jgi:hypothetical protein
VSVNLQPIREKLSLGFYVNNLYDISRLCSELASGNKNPTPFFVIQQICSRIAYYWDSGPIVVEDAKLVENELVNRMNRLLDTLESRMSDKEVLDCMNELVSTYMFLFK